MIVQWCMKGLSLASDAEATDVIDRKRGLLSAWWRHSSRISPEETRQQLSPESLDRHVNHFDEPFSGSDRRFGDVSPYISLSCGNVGRDARMATNHVRSALRTALWFGTEFGERDEAYVFSCWVVVAPRAAVAVEGVAEEVRSLTSYRDYSAFQMEGEVTAKIAVPDNQIRDCTKWWWQPGSTPRPVWVHHNPRFTAPETLTNVNELI